MKTLLLNLIISLLLTSSILAQNNVKNWNNIAWNSKIEQIKTKYQDNLIKLKKEKKFGNSSYCDYVLNNYQAFNSDFTVYFIMDSVTNSLKRILLEPNVFKSNSKIDSTKRMKIYTNIFNSMEKKYGVPSTHEKNKNINSAEWFFNSTIISLNFIHMSEVNFNSITISYEKAKQGFDFRKTKWGYSKYQVLSSEKLKPMIDTNNIIGYETTIAGMKCLIGYIFANNKLTRSKYVFEEEHSNLNDYIVDYEMLKGFLNKKYGNYSNKDDAFWLNDLYKDDVQQRGFAISLGQLFYQSNWPTQKTNIDLLLSGENYKISLVIEYVSKQFKNLEEKLKEKNTLKDF